MVMDRGVSMYSLHFLRFGKIFTVVFSAGTSKSLAQYSVNDATWQHDTAEAAFISAELCAVTDVGHVAVEYLPTRMKSSLPADRDNGFSWLWLRPKDDHYLVLGVASGIEASHSLNTGLIVNVMPAWHFQREDSGRYIYIYIYIYI